MTRIIPEKTMELWTACSLVDILTPRVWMWSRTAGVDQDVWTPDLRKWLVLELKAPSPPQANCWTGWMDFEIDPEQLRRYLNDFGQGRHPDVVYVFSDPASAPMPWSGSSPTPSHGQPVRVAHPYNRWTFPRWSYVVPATGLAWLLGKRIHNTTSVGIHLKAGKLQSLQNGRWVQLHSLDRYLTALDECYQWPISVACRADVRQQLGDPRTLTPFDVDGAAGTDDPDDADSTGDANGTNETDIEIVSPDAVEIRNDLISAELLDENAPAAELEFGGGTMFAAATEALERTPSRHRILVGVN